MRVLVVGSGGREHALIKAIKKSPKVDYIACCPGNGGISFDAECFNVGATDIDGVVALAKEIKADFVVVAPDDPLVMGMVDSLNAEGFKTFGPNKAAAIIEGSKVFSKNLMLKYGIPTAEYKVFDKPADVIAYITEKGEFPTVIKADGLALGKGVIIPETLDEAVAGVKEIMEDKIFGASGNNVVVEEFLTGPEVSVLAFTDGKCVKPMVSSMDHKRALDGDKGLNTGGMGTVSPNPYYTDEVAAECMEKIFIPTIEAMNKEGRTFLKTDIMEIFEAINNGTLSELDIEWDERACTCVIMASGGYPKSYPKGLEITGLTNGNLDGVTVYHAGTKLEGDKLVTAGGRVLGVTALGATLSEALEKSYEGVSKIHFENAHYRKDIGQRALKA